MLHGKISFTIVQKATLFFPNRAVTINVRLIVEIFEMTLLKTNLFELSDRGGVGVLQKLQCQTDPSVTELLDRLGGGGVGVWQK